MLEQGLLDLEGYNALLEGRGVFRRAPFEAFVRQSCL